MFQLFAVSFESVRPLGQLRAESAGPAAAGHHGLSLRSAQALRPAGPGRAK
jgi:hypothetical protein